MMKTIGLIGGMSWASTIEYYRIINEEVSRRLGGLHSAKILLNSVDFGEIEQHQRLGEWEVAGKQLADAALSLERAGANFVLICANTMHKVADVVQQAIHIPLIHVADVTAEKILTAGIGHVGLLGTQYTMEQDFLKTRFTDYGLSVLIPEEADRKTVHRIIFQELCKGIINPSSQAQMSDVLQRLTQQGANGIILGCTELSLIIHPEDVDVPLFDTALIHALSAVDKAMEV